MADPLKLRTLLRPPVVIPTRAAPQQMQATPIVPASREVDTFGPGAPKGPTGPGGLDLDPETLAVLRYQAFERRGPPERADYDNARVYDLALAHWEAEREVLQDAAAPALLEQSQEAARETPTGSALLEAAEEAGVEVVVLSDADYQRNHPPGSAGEFRDGTVYLPVSSIDDPSDTNPLEHELVHALFSEALDPNRPIQERVPETARAFEEAGLDPRLGAAIAAETQGWTNGGAVEHVAAAWLRRQIAREEAGLPAESPEEQAAALQRLTDNELAKHFQGQLEAEPPISDEQLVEQYLATTTGERHPPEGETVAEQAASIRQMMEQFLEPDYVDPPVPGPKFD